MRLFSIYELQKLSGIKMGTIRMWEVRYAILKPLRNSGNTRFYSLDEVRLLLNVAFLKERGRKISSITQLLPSEITKETTSYTDIDSQQTNAVNQLFYFMFALDIESFEEILDFAVFSWGIDETIEKLIIPFLEKVDVLSYQDSSLEVHFIVTALRKKLIMGIEKANPVRLSEKKALLFLPRGEHYDLVLLYLTYAFKRKGLQVLYLGTNISVENINQVVQAKKPHFLVTYLTAKFSSKIEDLLQYLQHQMPTITLFVTKSERVHLRFTYKNMQVLYFKDAVKLFESKII